MSRRRSIHKKLKYIYILFGIFIVFAFSFVFFNHLDPSLLTKISFYIDLANPAVQVVKIPEGLRKEEVAGVIGKKLAWSTQEEQNFLTSNLTSKKADLEGHYFPKTYLINKNDDPALVSRTMLNEFQTEVSKIEESQKNSVINREVAIKIASIIQREAADKNDMRLISGIIWNRIFSDMKLQIDATLQYAKGSEEDGWWPKVMPEDKKIKSAYNTYLYEGLPPGAIASPGLDAIAAAYNPQKTSCMFYLHDKNRNIHCSKTYEEHLKNIKKYY